MTQRNAYYRYEAGAYKVWPEEERHYLDFPPLEDEETVISQERQEWEAEGRWDRMVNHREPLPEEKPHYLDYPPADEDTVISRERQEWEAERRWNAHVARVMYDLEAEYDF